MKDIINKIEKKIQEKQKIIIGISGISLSLKTKFAKELSEKLTRVSETISIEENERVYLESLSNKNPEKYYYENAYDFNKINERIKEYLKHVDIVIVEGLLLFKNTASINYDIKIWLDTTFTTSINRAPKEKKEMYSNYFMWLQRQHFSIDNPKSKADIIVVTDEILKTAPTTYVDIKNSPNSIKNMKWLYEPTKWEIRNNGLYVETDRITDF